jgi:hypothetical protein
MAKGESGKSDAGAPTPMKLAEIAGATRDKSESSFGKARESATAPLLGGDGGAGETPAKFRAGKLAAFGEKDDIMKWFHRGECFQGTHPKSVTGDPD